MARKLFHSSAHSALKVPAGMDLALCGELVPPQEMRLTGVTCGMCVEVAANTVRSAAQHAGYSRGAVDRAIARAQRRSDRRRGGRGRRAGGER